MGNTKEARESVRRIKQYLDDADIKYNVTDDGIMYIFNGSAIVCVQAEPHGDDNEIVHVFSVVVDGARMGEKLFRKLLQLNNLIHFGAFSIENDLIIFRHKLLGGVHMDKDEFMYALIGVAEIADDYDDKIISEFGGRTGVGNLIEHRREAEGNRLVW